MARVLAICGGVLLSILAAIAWVVAGYADDVIDAGSGAAGDSLRETSPEAADWLERLSDSIVGGRPDQFRALALIAIAAGIVAVVASFASRPEAIWPEIVWGAAALAGLAPNIAFELWFSIWLFSGSLIVAAMVVHYLRRRDDLVRGATAAAAPHVATAARWTGDVARRTVERVGTKPPAAPAAAPTAPAGWYPDPSDGSRQRFWDGSGWTPHTL